MRYKYTACGQIAISFPVRKGSLNFLSGKPEKFSDLPWVGMETAVAGSQTGFA